MTLFLMLIGLFALIFINVPIAVALAVVAVAAMLLTQGVDILPNVALVMFDGATKFPLLAIPLFVMFSRIGLRSSLYGLIIVYLASTLPVALYMLRNYFQGIPEELEEAAMVDGLSRFGVIRKITIPLASPAIAAVALGFGRAVVEGQNCLRFSPKSLESIGIGSHLLPQQLDRHLTLKVRVIRQINRCHPAPSQFRQQFIVADVFHSGSGRRVVRNMGLRIEGRRVCG